MTTTVKHKIENSVIHHDSVKCNTQTGISQLSQLTGGEKVAPCVRVWLNTDFQCWL